MKNPYIMFILLILAAFYTQNLYSQQDYLDFKESDPIKLGWMKGFPPPSVKFITNQDGSYFSFPKLRWTVCNIRQLMPTVGVYRGPKSSMDFTFEIDNNIDNLTFNPIGENQTVNWTDALAKTYTDGIIVLHKGVVVYEKYFGALNENGQHAAMSMTKSFVGTLGAILAAEGKIDPNKLVSDYISELKNSGFGDATVRQVMDMTTAIKFSENYADPKAEIWDYTASGTAFPKPEGYTGPRSYYEYMPTIKKQGSHGEAFGYRTINTDVLGWIIARVSGKSVDKLLSEKIWSKIGMEQDAYFTVDAIGTPFTGGGLSAGLRDLARFGSLILNNGKFGYQQIIPLEAVVDIMAGGDKSAFEKSGYSMLKGWSYRNMWWVSHDEHNTFSARGVHGQRIFIDPVAEVVIVRFASHPVAGNTANDPYTIPAFQSVVNYLMNKK